MWSDLYSAMMTEESDRIAHDRHERQIHRMPPAPSPKDIEQDRRIRALEQENRTLKCYVAGLVQLMLRKGVIQHGELMDIIAEAEKAGLVRKSA